MGSYTRRLLASEPFSVDNVLLADLKGQYAEVVLKDGRTFSGKVIQTDFAGQRIVLQSLHARWYNRRKNTYTFAWHSVQELSVLTR